MIRCLSRGAQPPGAARRSGRAPWGLLALLAAAPTAALAASLVATAPAASGPLANAPGGAAPAVEPTGPSLAAQAPQFFHVQGGGFQDIAVVEHQSILYGAAVADGGRIHYWHAASGSWKEGIVDDAVRDRLQGIQILDHENFYAVGKGGVILHSSTQGETWSWINEGNPILDQVTPTPGLGDLWAIWMVDTDVGWVVGCDGVLVYTANGWVSYAYATLPAEEYGPSADPRDIYDILFLDEDVAIAAAEYSQVLRSTDGGFNWTAVSVPSSCGATSHPNAEFWGLAAWGAEEEETLVVVGGRGTTGGITAWSDDRGASWEQIALFDLTDPPSVGFPCGISTLYGLTSPAADQAVAVGYGRTVLSLEPSGSTGSEYDLCWCDDTSPMGEPYWVQTHGGGAESGPPFGAVTSLGSDDLWLCGAFGVLRTSENGGSSWQEQGTVEVQRLLGGDFIDAEVGCVIGQLNVIRRTDDGGETWNVVLPTPSIDDWGRSLALEPGGLGLAIGGGHFMARTDDEGENWSEIDVPSQGSTQANLHALCIAAAGSSTHRVYVGGESGWVSWADLSSVDGQGQLSWNHVSINTSETIRGLAFADELTGYAVGSDMSAFFTDDGGQNWVEVQVRNPVTGANFQSVATWDDGSQAIAVGTSGTVYLKETDRFVPVDLGSLAVSVDLNAVAAVEYGSDVLFMAVGDGGNVLHFDGLDWSSPKSKTNSHLYAVSFLNPASAFIVGQSFYVAEYR